MATSTIPCIKLLLSFLQFMLMHSTVHRVYGTSLHFKHFADDFSQQDLQSMQPAERDDIFLH